MSLKYYLNDSEKKSRSFSAPLIEIHHIHFVISVIKCNGYFFSSVVEN